MTSATGSPMESSSGSPGFQASSLWLIAVGAAAIGAISLALPTDSPYGPIAVLIGTHLPLMLAAWTTAGLRREGVGGLSLRIVWSFLIYFNIVIGLILLLGVAQVLSRESVFAVLAGAGLTLMYWARRHGRSIGDLPMIRQRTVWIRLPVFIGVAVVATHALLHPEYDFDVLTYHLFFPARWAQEHRVCVIPTWFSDPAQAYAPSASEIHFLSLMLPLGSDHLARCGQLVFWLELLAVVAALGRELGMRPAARVLSTGCVLLTPAIAWQAGTAMVDVALAAHLSAAALFSIRSAREARKSDCAGFILAAGLAAGTKFLALPYLLALSPAWGRALVAITRRRLRRGNKRPRFAAYVMTGFLFAAWNGGYWYVRNWLLTGNPLYPVEVRLAGTTVFPGAFDRGAMLNSTFNQCRRGWAGLQEVLENLLRIPAWSSAPGAWDAVRTSAIATELILILTLALTVAAMMKLAGRRRAELVSIQLSIIAMIGLFWWVIPYQESRFAWTMLVLALVAAFAMFSRLSATVGGVLTALFAASWLALTAAPLIATYVTFTSVIAGAVAGLLYVMHLKSARMAVPAIVFICAAGISVALWSVDQNGDPPRRATQHHSIWLGFGDTWTWVDDHVVGKTFAYAGNNVPYFLTGPHQGNRVIVVSAGGEPDWLHHDFARLPAVAGLGRPNVTDFAVSRIQMDGRAWLRGLLREKVDYAVVTRLFRGVTVSHRHDRDGFPIERQWLDALAIARDASGRPLSSRTIFGGGWLLFYKLNLTDDESVWPRLTSVTQTETDALDRQRRDGTAPGFAIDGYPLAAQVISESKLVALPK